jgi:Flp pilus assembly protein TadD
MRQLLRLFRDKTEADAFQSVYSKSLDQLDAEFQAFLKPQLTQAAAQLDAGSTSEYARQVRQAEEHFKNGEWGKAAETYRRAIALEPEPRHPVNVFFRLGEAEEKLGDHAAAMEAFMKAGQLFETGEEAFERAFDLAIQHDHPEIAVGAYESLLSVYPADADRHLSLGDALLRWNKSEQAVAPLRRATQLSTGDPAQAHYLLGRAYWNIGKADLARRSLLAALDIAPSFEKAQQLLLQVAEGRK